MTRVLFVTVYTFVGLVCTFWFHHKGLSVSVPIPIRICLDLMLARRAIQLSANVNPKN